jgi:hypothetical protein
MLIYVILCGLCLVNEWNAIINLQNDIVKNIQNRTKNNSIDSGSEKAGSLVVLSEIHG